MRAQHPQFNVSGFGVKHEKVDQTVHESELQARTSTPGSLPEVLHSIMVCLVVFGNFIMLLTTSCAWISYNFKGSSAQEHDALQLHKNTSIDHSSLQWNLDDKPHNYYLVLVCVFSCVSFFVGLAAEHYGMLHAMQHPIQHPPLSQQPTREFTANTEWEYVKHVVATLRWSMRADFFWQLSREYLGFWKSTFYLQWMFAMTFVMRGVIGGYQQHPNLLFVMVFLPFMFMHSNRMTVVLHNVTVASLLLISTCIVLSSNKGYVNNTDMHNQQVWLVPIDDSFTTHSARCTVICLLLMNTVFSFSFGMCVMSHWMAHRGNNNHPWLLSCLLVSLIGTSFVTVRYPFHVVAEGDDSNDWFILLRWAQFSFLVSTNTMLQTQTYWDNPTTTRHTYGKQIACGILVVSISMIVQGFVQETGSLTQLSIAVVLVLGTFLLGVPLTGLWENIRMFFMAILTIREKKRIAALKQQAYKFKET
jgi:hypothetical protein